jgi:glycosyltransferase involved in cell wall biosynthesis
MTAVLVTHWGKTGGGPRFTAELTRALASRCVGIVLQHNADAEVAADLATAAEVTETVRTYGRSRVSVLASLWRLPVNAWRTHRLVRRHGVTCVVSAMEGPFQSLAVPLVLPRRVRYVTIVHDASEHPGDGHPVKRLGRRNELARADAVVTLSTDVTRRLVEEGRVVAERAVTLFHPAFGTAGRPRPVPGRGARIGFLGRLVAYKGLDLFVEVARAVHRARPDLRFEVWGDGPERGVRSRDTSGDVGWHLGWIPEAEMDRRVRELDLVVLPYVEASQSGVAALAAAAGVPCVVTPVGGLVEQVRGRGGAVADDVSAAAVADTVLRVLGDPAEYQRLSTEGVRSARGDRSWDVFATRLLEVAR